MGGGGEWISVGELVPGGESLEEALAGVASGGERHMFSPRVVALAPPTLPSAHSHDTLRAH